MEWMNERNGSMTRDGWPNGRPFWDRTDFDVGLLLWVCVVISRLPRFFYGPACLPCNFGRDTEWRMANSEFFSARHQIAIILV